MLLKKIKQIQNIQKHLNLYNCKYYYSFLIMLFQVEVKNNINKFYLALLSSSLAK